MTTQTKTTRSKRVKQSKTEAKTFAMDFVFDRSTKTTHRFTEVAADGEEVVGTLYVKKSALGDTPPDALTVHVTVV